MVRYTSPGGVRCLLVLERSVESGVDRRQVVHARRAARDAVAIRPSVRPSSNSNKTQTVCNIRLKVLI